ncbi:unnamed protein product [Bursaphelenchus xylophilus]|uniref:(pine wood nematode) hypothetical protein n=1 Tax=Bursaphelenchus xylophilus TaxID=6326 RepID=A0A1I7RXL8_BURXY|nr:unnamed protein product [Bursaphelenchus xylophilus]CAG9126565.1 unnamed protein product [Bursaphelenchus xylophilus]
MSIKCISPLGSRKDMTKKRCPCKLAYKGRTPSVRHEDIRARTGLKDVCKEAKKRKWKYMEKMQLRREEGRWDQRLMDWTPPYKRPLGRLRLRWTDDFRKHHGLRWRDLILTKQWNPD